MATGQSSGVDLTDPNLYGAAEDYYNLPPGLLYGVAKQESTFNPAAQGPVTKTGDRATGLMQFMGGTAKDYGIDPTDPIQSIDGSARMYSDLLKKYNGDTVKARAAYNWGSGNLDKYGLENAPKETRDYIARTTKYMNEGAGRRQYAENTATDPNAPQTMNDASPPGLSGIQDNYKGQPPAQAADVGADPEDAALAEYKASLNAQPKANDEDAALAEYKASLSGGGDTSVPNVQTGETPKTGKYSSFLAGLSQGATLNFADEGLSHLATGIGVLTGGPDGNAKIADYDKIYPKVLSGVRGIYDQAHTDNPYTYDAGNLVGSLVPGAIMKGASALEKGAEVIGRGGTYIAQKAADPTFWQGLGTAAKAGAGWGAAGGFGAGEDGFVSRLENAGLGAVEGTIAAPAVHALGSGLAFGAAKLYSPIINKFKSGYDYLTGNESTPLKPVLSPLGQQAEATNKTATDLGFNPLTYSESAGTMNAPWGNRLETALEKNPLSGMTEKRQSDRAAAQNVVTDLSKQYGDKALDSFKNMNIDDIRKIADNPDLMGERKIDAQRVVKIFDNTPDDFKNIIQTSSDITGLRRRVISDNRYAEAEKAADDAGLTVLPNNMKNTYRDVLAMATDPTQPKKGLPEYIAGLQQDFIPNMNTPQTLQQLRTSKSNLEAEAKDVAKNDDSGMKNRVLSKLVQATEADIQNLYKNPLVTPPNVTATANRYPGLQNQIGTTPSQDMAAKIADFRKKYDMADKYYQESVVPYNTGAEVNALKQGSNPDLIMQQFTREKGLTGENEVKINKLVNMLDPEGRDSARAGLLGAIIQNSSTVDGLLIPTRFAKQMENNKSAINVLFKGDDLTRLQGIQNIMSRLQRPSWFAENPPTGNKATDTFINTLAGTGAAGVGGATVGGAIAGLPGAAAGAALSVGARAAYGQLSKYLLTNPTGKRLLFTSGKLSDSDPKLDAIIQKIIPMVTNATARSSANFTGQSPGGQTQ